jgi:acetyl esterase
MEGSAPTKPEFGRKSNKYKEAKMAMDDDVRQFLDMAAAAGAPPIATLPPQEARDAYDALMAFIPQSEAVMDAIQDVNIAGPGGDMTLRIYRPLGEGPFPTLMYFHGGGWYIGSVGNYDSVCKELSAGAGCITVSVEYRLAPEHKFPAASDDCLAATRWVAANIGDYGGDPARIALAGDSAGGNLAAVTALLLRDEGGPVPIAQLLIYPVTDHPGAGHGSMAENAEGYLLTRADMDAFSAHYLRSAEDIQDARVHPFRASSHANLPAAFIITAEFDPLRDEGEAYGRALAAAGVPVRVSRYDGTIHGAIAFYPIFRSGKAMLDDSCSWLREQFA